MDLFKREQQILDKAVLHIKDIHNGSLCDAALFEELMLEYGRLLQRLRNDTKMSNETMVELGLKNLDLFDKMQIDALTDIYNRYFLEGCLKQFLNSLSLSAGKLGVVMIDIDYFKKYNDTYGHNMGDKCLIKVAQTLKNSIQRAGDFVARFGGAEFIVILPNTDKDGTCMMANKMIENVKACNIPHEKNEAASCVTISIGATTGDVNHTHKNVDYIKRADKALYISKQNGRNQFTYMDFDENIA
jgi:diguanylate cyclase (GGDEF)-like protein